jgi:hypothetical protein
MLKQEAVEAEMRLKSMKIDAKPHQNHSAFYTLPVDPSTSVREPYLREHKFLKTAQPEFSR